MTRRQRHGKAAADHRHCRDRLVTAYEAAPEEIRLLGRGWYPSALTDCAALAGDGIDAGRAAAVVAALSPQTRWRENLLSARIVIDAARNGQAPLGARGYFTNIRKAYTIARGAEIGRGPGDGFGGEAPKVRSFWANICGDVEAVTLDVWAMRVATGRRQTAPPSGRRYAAGRDWYRAAAAEGGECPRDFQAIVWTAARGPSEHFRDYWSARQGSFFRPGPSLESVE